MLNIYAAEGRLKTQLQYNQNKFYEESISYFPIQPNNRPPMKFLKKLCERILDWLVTSNMVGYVILLAGSIILGLLFGGEIILDKVLGRVNKPWHITIGFFLALVTCRK